MISLGAWHIMSNYVPPNQIRQLRACMVCSVVQLQSVGLHLYSCYLSKVSSITFLPAFPSKLIYLLKLVQRFIREGCPNCESFLDLAGHPDSVQECTSQVYEGLITLVDPERSWVAKWQRLDGYVPGVYAVKVVGMVSP